MEPRTEIIQAVLSQVQYTILEGYKIMPRQKRIEVPDDIGEVFLADTLVTNHRHNPQMLQQQVVGCYNKFLPDGDIDLIIIHIELTIVILDVAVLCQQPYLLNEVEFLVKVCLRGLIAPTAFELLKVEVAIGTLSKQASVNLINNCTVSHYFKFL